MLKKKIKEIRLTLASLLIGKEKFVKNVDITIDKVVSFKNLDNCNIRNVKIYYKKITKAGLLITGCSYLYIKNVKGFKIGDK